MHIPMPETKAQRHPVESKEHEQASKVERTTEFSDEALKSLESAERAAIQAVKKFADTVDEMLPTLRADVPSRRQGIIDAAMEMADGLVHTQYDFLRNVAQSAGKALSRPDDGK